MYSKNQQMYFGLGILEYNICFSKISISDTQFRLLEIICLHNKWFWNTFFELYVYIQ